MILEAMEWIGLIEVTTLISDLASTEYVRIKIITGI
jgi:hypothetical protein